jgi:UDP-3-O-[3-hydroxymyristoyl] glucosamine N-acyltransferase
MLVYRFMPTYIAPNTMIGKHVQAMPMCVIGHDVVIKDYVTLCPSCTVSGYVVIEEEVFVVAGSTIVNGRVGSAIRNALTRTAGVLGRDHLQFE